MFRRLTARLMRGVGRVPGVSGYLRRQARRFSENSVVTVRAGLLAGMKWRRHHRYVSGYWLGTHELATQEALARHLRSGDVFYDVGANAGFYSMLAARIVGPTGCVYAFEPLPDNIASIREQVELNATECVEIVSTPVGALEGTMPFSYAERDTSTAHLGPARDPDERTEMIQVTTLDRFAATHRQPTLVKIDVEGYEGDVLEGACTLVRQGVRLAIELHGIAQGAAVANLLRTNGYRFERLDGSEATHPESEPYIIALPMVAEAVRVARPVTELEIDQWRDSAVLNL